MDSFAYRNGKLQVERVDVGDIVAEVDTPVYLYSRKTFEDHLDKIQRAYRDLDTVVCFSVKACANINILRFMAEKGSGFDIVSGGELYRALEAGADPSKVVYAGVGKTDAEINQALDAGIAYFNIESEQELENLIRLADQRPHGVGPVPKAALRVNPDIDYGEHAFLKTGKKETKFGVDIDRAVEVFDRYGQNPSVSLSAVHVHLGTGGKTIDPYVQAVQKILSLIETLRKQGHTVEALDLGGGYGAAYTTGAAPPAEAYAAGLVPLLKGKGLRLILEPGKSICANAGILLTRVLYTKQSGNKRFAIVDAGMNDLIRPSLYRAFHFIWPTEVTRPFVPPARTDALDMDGTQVVDVVGPVCEGADFFAKDRLLPPLQRGDLLAIFSAGAYGFTMSSNYNSRCRVPEVLVEDDSFRVIRRRESYKDLVALEQ